LADEFQTAQHAHGATDPDDIAALVRCVGDVDAFATEHWGRAPLVRRDADRFGDLLDLRAVDQLLGSVAQPPSFRVVRDGDTLPAVDVTRTVRLAGRDLEHVADLGRIAAQIEAGATLVLQGLQRTWLPIARFCRRLERATSHAVQANAYLSPAGSRGLARHFDNHDVIVLQLWGEKAWDVDGLGALRLAAGDVMYLPTGTEHSAATGDAPSLHLTVGLLRDTYRSLVERALADPRLDDPLPLGYADDVGRGRLVDELRERLAGAIDALASADPGALAADAAHRATTRRRPLMTGQLRSILGLADLDHTTRLRRRIDQPATLTVRADGTARLEMSDRTIDLPAVAVTGAHFVLDRTELAVGEIPGLDESGRAVLARRLVREGLLEVVDAAAGDVS